MVTCSGTLINDRYIVTAAHCFYNEMDPDVDMLDHYVVYAGLHNQTQLKEGTILEVEELILHEDYDHDLWHRNDIALLRLATPVQFNDKISPICLPTNKLINETKENFKNLRIAGWGLRDEEDKNSLPDVLYDAPIVQKDTFFCKTKNYPGWAGQAPKVLDSNICAGNALTDTCEGDSGGPLMTHFRGRTYLVGIVSWGEGCARDIKPGVYTRMSTHTTWVSKSMKEDVTWCKAR